VSPVCPQRLKPGWFNRELFGTLRRASLAQGRLRTEAVPFPVKFKIWVKGNVNVKINSKVKGDGQECPSHTGVAALCASHSLWWKL
jgi:hypothetical protein